MSLLLDALKRAAQEKLEKQRQDETGAQSTVAGNKTAVPEDSWSLDITDARADASSAKQIAGTQTELPAETGSADISDLKLGGSNTDLRLHRADVLASELQDFMGRNTTEQRSNRAAGEIPAESAGGSGMFTVAATPAAAARLFKSKRAGSARPKYVWLISGSVAATLLMGVFCTIWYWNSLNQSNVMLDRAQAGNRPVQPANPEPLQDTRKIESDLLIEQEDIGTLLKETLSDKSPDTVAAVPAEKPVAADAVPRTEARPQVAAKSRNTTPRLMVQQNRQEPLHDILMQAYNAYQRNDMVTAEIHYRQALVRAPENRDALLGFAAIATQQGEYETAMESYTALLRLDPNDDLALAGISGLKQITQQAGNDESGIKRLLTQRPESAQLHFALGNVYAGRNDWPKAQSAYFDAHRFDSQNPDYAYNLAISLEHLQQPDTALRYYELALTLAAARKPNFDVAQVTNRVLMLQANKPAPNA